MKISVLIAGPVVQNSLKTTEKIRKIFPDSDLILSTWKGENNFENVFDKVVFSEKLDEFYFCDYELKKRNNVNFQIKSTVAGLKETKSEYVLKLRSDFLLKEKSFLKYWNMMPKAESDFQIFKHKILDCSYFTRNPRSDIHPYSYHPSDIVLFGLREDLINLFDVPYMTEQEANYNLQKDIINKYVPEQHIFINCLKKNGKIPKCRFYNDVNEENMIETERYFASNFIFLDYNQFGVVPPNKFKSLSYEYQTCITYVEGQKLYQKYVDSDFVVPNKDYERHRMTKLYSTIIKRNSFARLISHIISMFFWGEKNKSFRQKIRRKIQVFLAPKFF